MTENCRHQQIVVSRLEKLTLPGTGQRNCRAKDPDVTKHKQPFYIKLKSYEPMFDAAISQFPRDAKSEPGEADGFAIVTTASDKGMVDIHDRAPLVLPPDVAREWLESGLAPEPAADLAQHHVEPVEWFEGMR